MSEQAKFIAVHGIDGTGKTTLVNAVKTVLEKRGLDLTPERLLPPENPWKGYRGEFGSMSPTQRMFYKLGTKAAEGEFIAEGLANGATAVKDRWVIDVLADETHKGARAPGSVFDSILRPDLAVVLWCNEDERMSRVTRRPDATEDDLVPCAPGTRAYYFQRYLANNIAASAMDSMTLDSTQIPPDELARIVVERVYE